MSNSWSLSSRSSKSGGRDKKQTDHWHGDKGRASSVPRRLGQGRLYRKVSPRSVSPEAREGLPWLWCHKIESSGCLDFLKGDTQPDLNYTETESGRREAVGGWRQGALVRSEFEWEMLRT